MRFFKSCSLKIIDIPTPKPSASDVIIRVSAAALNHRDLFARQKLYPGAAGNVPVCADGVGVVTDAGSEALKREWLGKRVIPTPGRGWISDPDGPDGPYRTVGGVRGFMDGTMQEYICVPADEIVPCPAHLSDAEAAAAPLAALTAWRATMMKAAVKTGQNILVTGIGGGVALAAMQFAIAVGANVYVTSGSEDKINRAKTLGAKGGVNYKDADWHKKLAALLPKSRPKLDAIVDGAGGEIVIKAQGLLKNGGIISSYGMTVGPKVTYTMTAVMRNIEMRGSTMGSRDQFRDCIDFINAKKIHPVVSSVHAFDKAEGAFQIMKAGTNFGKLVVMVNPSSPKL